MLKRAEGAWEALGKTQTDRTENRGKDGVS